MRICGTGHRPDKLGGYTKQAAQRLRRIATAWIEENKPDAVVSGMALGWDTALAKAAIISGVPLIAAVPFKGQESRWPAESQDTFNKLLSVAKEIVYVSDGGYAAWKMQVRNRWMVDNTDAVLALYNGDLSGGTYNCVTYASEKQKQIFNLWGQYAIHDQREARLRQAEQVC